MRQGGPVRTATTIARLLSTEGFTEELANRIDEYWQHCAGLTVRQKRRQTELEAALSELANRLTVGERLVLGKFIGHHKKMAFDVGLRVGLGAFAAKNMVEVSHGEADLPTATQHKPGEKAE